MIIRFSELCEKNVINCNNGSILGNISDIEISTEECMVNSLYVDSKKSLFGKSNLICIPWTKIEKFGVDVVIVNTCQTNISDKCTDKCNDKPKRFLLK